MSMGVLDSFRMASTSTSEQYRCNIAATAFRQPGRSGAILGLAFIDLLNSLHVELSRREKGRQLVCCEHWRVAKQGFEVV